MMADGSRPGADVAARALDIAERAANVAEAAARSAARAYGRSFADFGELLPAEQKLLEASRKGEVCDLTTPQMRQVREAAYVAMGAPATVELALDVLAARTLSATGWRRTGAGLIWQPDPLPEELRTRIDALPPVLHAFADELWRFIGGHPAAPPPEADRETASRQLLPLVVAASKRYLEQVAGWRALDAVDPALKVRAGFLRFLALGGDATAPVHEAGVALISAVVDGELDMSGATLPHVLWLEGCRIDAGIVLRDAATRTVGLQGSRTGQIDADRVAVHGSLFVRRGFHVEGGLRLIGGSISGDLASGGAEFRNAGGKALSADGARIGGNVSLCDGFVAEGEIRLAGARIDRQFDCSGGTFRNADGYALGADGAEIGGTVFLSDGFAAAGEVRIVGTRIGGQLSCRAGTIRNAGRPAIYAGSAAVGGRAFFDRGFVADGMLDLVGARVSGDAHFESGTIRNPIDPTRPARGIDATADTDRFDGIAIRADRAEFGGSVFLRRGFVADGEVRLPSARIKGDLALDAASFRNVTALPGDRARLERRSDYGLKLSGMEIDGVLWLAPGDKLHDSAPRIEGSIDLRQTHAATLMISAEALPPPTSTGPGNRSLNNAVVLDGLTYDHIDARGATDLETAVNAMIQRQPKRHLGRDFRPQPFEQAAKVFRAMGREEEAKRLAKKKAKGERWRSRLARIDRMRRGTARPAGWRVVLWPLTSLSALLAAIISGLGLLVQWLVMDWFLGRGYDRSKPVVAALLLLLIGTLLYIPAARDGVFVPADKGFVQRDENRRACAAPGQGTGELERIPWATCRRLPDGLTPFHPLVYSLDLMIPFSALGERRDWKIDTSRDTTLELWGLAPVTVSGSVVYGWSIFQAYAALGLYAILIAFVTGTVKKE